ncbi:hypothetical protein [Oceanospirillum beijerinckii]|uniref:hypothetical protein n=1 Tax=Oceanospirillum beijerinckii TaxID=64976 RepID=UPI00041AD258|nr:hypothetical protein [Oceanospirillum beijerinckii]MAC47819.1 hypothetical protein [Oceanospirillum sp.]
MSLQEISVSNTQKKKLQKAILDESVLVQEDDGDLVVHVAAYLDYKAGTRTKPLEEIVGEDELDLSAEFIVLS